LSFKNVSAGTVGKDFVQTMTNPVKGSVNAVKHGKELFGLGKPAAPDTSAQDQLLAQQKEQQAALDDEENRRRKKLLASAQGARAYRGSPLFRAPPSNSAGGAAPVAAVVGRAGSAGSGGAAAGSYVRRSFLL
jgi:hypothetical protein